MPDPTVAPPTSLVDAAILVIDSVLEKSCQRLRKSHHTTQAVTSLLLCAIHTLTRLAWPSGPWMPLVHIAENGIPARAQMKSRLARALSHWPCKIIPRARMPVYSSEALLYLSPCHTVLVRDTHCIGLGKLMRVAIERSTAE